MLQQTTDQVKDNHVKASVMVRRLNSACAGSGTRAGQALVELALTVPMLLLLIALAMNFGGLINAWINVSNAARAAGDYAILGGASAHLPTQATSDTLKALINADLAYLPNLSSSNPQMCIREENNGTLTTLLQSPSGACSSYSAPPSDVEKVDTGSTATYANLAVDITYTYTPFYTVTSFIGHPLAATPTSVHQRAVMRILQ